MILTAHQPVYLPWLGLLHKIALSDTYVFFDDVQYLPRDWNNRNKIKTPQGVIWLTVPVLDKGYRQRVIRDLRINNQLPWRRKHWGSIQANYGKAPFFASYAPFFEDLYRRDWEFLTELNEYVLRWLLGTLGIDVPFLKASALRLEGTKSDLVLDMCRKLRADVYIFGAQGRDYARVEDFEAANIRVVFQDYVHPTYQQCYSGFQPYMAAIDLLLNCGPDSLRNLRAGNEAFEEALRGRCLRNEGKCA